VLCFFRAPSSDLQSSQLIYWKADYGAIRNYLHEVNWESVFEDKDVSEMWEIFRDKVTALCEKHVPLKKPNKKVKNIWMTKDTLKEIKKREKAWRRYKSFDSEVNYKKFKVLRNRVVKLIKRDKTAYQKKLFKQFRSNPKRFYGYFRRMQTVKTTVASIRTADGKLTTTDQETAETLCDYFGEVFTKEDTWKQDGITPVANSLEILITEELILKALTKLKVDKSPGPDNIHPMVLREAATEVVEPLTMIFRKSLSQGELPEDWRKANISPIHKKGPKDEAGNYRPVSLTSVVCKLLETVVKEQMVAFLDERCVVSQKQHGFVKGRSCLTNLLEVFEHWTRCLDEGYGVDVIYLDYRKAFDTVPHQRLITKLRSMGFGCCLMKWIESFLSNRVMRVSVNGQHSPWSMVVSGVPQGSVLGPLLFLLYVNDLPDHIKTNIRMFADDTKIWTRLTGAQDAAKLQEDLDMLSDWSARWLLKFNPQKCKLMHLRHNMDTKYHITQDNQEWNIQSTQQEKDLGVLTSSDMAVSHQCMEAASRANRVLGMVRRQFKVLDKESFMIIYKGYVRPHLEYAIQAWSPYLRRDIECLEKIQRRATKLVEGFRN